MLQKGVVFKERSAEILIVIHKNNLLILNYNTTKSWYLNLGS